MAMQDLNGHYNFVAGPTLSWCDVERTVKGLDLKPAIRLLFQCDPFGYFPYRIVSRAAVWTTRNVMTACAVNFIVHTSDADAVADAPGTPAAA